MSTLLLDGQNALPGIARGTGYRYRYPTLDGAMAALTAGRRPAAPRHTAGAGG